MRYIILVMFWIIIDSCQDNSEKSQKDKKINELEEKIQELEKEVEENKDRPKNNYPRNEDDEQKIKNDIFHHSNTKYVFGKAKIKVVQELIGTRKPIIPDDPTSPLGPNDTHENEYYIVTGIISMNNYNEDKRYNFKDVIRRTAMKEKNDIILVYSFDVTDIQIYEFDTYADASKSREALGIKEEITIFDNL
ncbi:MAG: hypothetical protein WDO71_20160 [Bacteroidota bacterium]